MNQGWQCPICLRGISPDTKTCPFCPAQAVNIPTVWAQGYTCYACGNWVAFGCYHQCPNQPIFGSPWFCYQCNRWVYNFEVHSHVFPTWTSNTSDSTVGQISVTYSSGGDNPGN